MDSKLGKPICSFNHAFGIFSEVRHGYSFDDAVSNSERALRLDSEYYAPVYSKVLGRLIQSSPWTGSQKSGMNDIRRTFNRGGLSGRDARAGLEGLGLSSATASQVVRQWEDHMPGFDAAGFEGLGEEPIVLRPNQVEQRRESRMRREAEAADMSRAEELQGDLFASTGRKKSKYNGTLVNEFPEGLEGVSPVVSAATSRKVPLSGIWYHGFKPYDDVSTYTEGLTGFWLTADKDYASDYTGVEGPIIAYRVNPQKVNPQRVLIVPWDGSTYLPVSTWQSFLNENGLSSVSKKWDDPVFCEGNFDMVCPGWDEAGYEYKGSEDIKKFPVVVNVLYQLLIEFAIPQFYDAVGVFEWGHPCLVVESTDSVVPQSKPVHRPVPTEGPDPRFKEGELFASVRHLSAKHPSIRYQVLCELVAPERRRMVASALSGELDSRLYSMYQAAGGGDDVNLTNTGENGRVSLKVDTGSGISTEVDLGGNLETGYVVQSINDPLGIFPEGTEQGDFLEFGTVEVILKSLAGDEGLVGSGSSRKVAQSSLDEWQGISFESMLGRFMSGEVDAGAVIEKGRRSGWTVEEIDDFLWKHGRLPYGIEEYAEHPDWLQDSFDDNEDEYDEGSLVAGSASSLFSSASPGDHVELRYESEDGSSNKFINMDYSGGPTFTSTWGRFGSAGRQTEYPVSQWDSYYRGKRSKGYTDVTDGEEVIPRIRRDVPARKESVAHTVPEKSFQPPLPAPQKPKRSEPRQLDLFASRRPQISGRFFTKG